MTGVGFIDVGCPDVRERVVQIIESKNFKIKIGGVDMKVTRARTEAATARNTMLRQASDLLLESSRCATDCAKLSTAYSANYLHLGIPSSVQLRHQMITGQLLFNPLAMRFNVPNNLRTPKGIDQCRYLRQVAPQASRIQMKQFKFRIDRQCRICL